MIAYRPRRTSDVAACMALVERTRIEDGYPPLWPVDLPRFIESPAEVAAWVAELDGQVVGHVALHDASVDPVLAVAGPATALPAEDLTVVARLFGSPDVRGRGLGRGLLKLATTEAHAAGKQPVLDVAKTLVPAIALYERAGWERVGDISFSFEDHDPLACWVYVGPPPP